MVTMTYSIILLLLTLLASSGESIDESRCGCWDGSIGRDDFPAGFIFGAASSAYQFEGAYEENGKGQSMWDNYTHAYPDKIQDHKNGDVAINFYHYYKEDVKIARDMRLDAYRISVSWPRILPGGTIEAGVNQDGIDYYSNLIDEFLANGLIPFVTILHFDLPQALQDAYGGFLSSRIVNDFLAFANLLFHHFGSRVKHWITINEPWTMSIYGYSYGWYAPGRCSKWQNTNCTAGDSTTEPYIVAHNLLLAHSAVVNLYRTKYQNLQKGQIGISLVSYWFEALDEGDENYRAKGRALDFMLGWFMEPLVRGHYPETMRSRVGDRLPEFGSEESSLLKGSFDFIGFNYYASIYAFHEANSFSSSYIRDSGFDITGMKNGIPIGDRARNSSRIYIFPKGLRQILRYIKENYNDPLIYITENGLDEAADEANPIKDLMRKNYIHDHLCCVLEAVKGVGVNVKGYFVWSLMDNFEWASGFSVRFGLYYIDYRDKYLRRYAKYSALWFKKFLLNQEGTSDE